MSSIEYEIEKMIHSYHGKESVIDKQLADIRGENALCRKRGQSKEERSDLIKQRVHLSAQKMQIQQFKADLDSLLDHIDSKDQD